MSQYALDYIDVASRLVEFREKHPDGSIQQHALDFREVGGKTWVIYTAAAYRTPDDVRPGHGTAWEQVPGKTNFTRDSEVQNAETSAWGRAIVAVLAADTKKGIASAEEVRNASETAKPTPATDPVFLQDALDGITQATNADELVTVRGFIGQGITDGKCSNQDRDNLKKRYAAKEREIANA
jgi:hypothetical protein